MSKVPLVEIPADKQEKRGWAVRVNGEIVPSVKLVEIENPRFGRLVYGSVGGAYDSWAFAEIGGGGAVSVPFTFFNKRLFIGVVEQKRDNQGGIVLNVPRGFLNPGENHFEAVKRETTEEVGLALPLEYSDISGQPANTNSTFFVTSDPGEGVKFFSLNVPLELLEPDEEYTAPKLCPAHFPSMKVFKFKADTVKAVGKGAEQIFKCVFVPWRYAAKLSDMFTKAAVSVLWASLDL
jgi:ADP-ribose pyrophosphatase YjhB (NUDIX family)